MKRLLQAALVIPLALLVIVVVKAGPSSAGASSSCGTGTTSGTGCACPSSPYLSVSQRLYGVAGSSSSDVWAVGLQPPDSLIMHWDGTCWSVAYNQPVGYLRDTSAVSASDAWAVGASSDAGGSHPATLAHILEWRPLDGRAPAQHRFQSRQPVSDDGQLILERVDHLDSSMVEVLNVAGHHGQTIHLRRRTNECVDHRQGLRELQTAPSTRDWEGNRENAILERGFHIP